MVKKPSNQKSEWSKEDLDIFTVVDEPKEAAAVIKKFYVSRYKLFNGYY